MVIDSPEGKRIVSAVETAGVKNQLNFNFRYYPAVVRARQMISDGFLGRIFSYRACYYRASYINPEKPLSWRLTKEFAGGGALMTGSGKGQFQWIIGTGTLIYI